MPVMMASRRNTKNRKIATNGQKSDSGDTIRVKVKDARRKQQWVDPLPTPPRSPSSGDERQTQTQEPTMDEIWDLWQGSGLVDVAIEGDQQVTLDSALESLGFQGEEDSASCSTFRRVSLGDIDAEELFNTLSSGVDLINDGATDDELFSQLMSYSAEHSPPPTNPPSPPASMESDQDQQIMFPINCIIKQEVSTNPSSPAGANDMEDSDQLHLTFAMNEIKTENKSSPSSLYGDSSDDNDTSSQVDEGSGSDSGFEDKGQHSPSYDEGLIGEDLINAQPDIFFNDDDPFQDLFDHVDAHAINTMFEEDLRQAEQRLDLKRKAEDDPLNDLRFDCMWNGESASELGLPISPIETEFGQQSSSPTFEELFGCFIQQPKIKTEVLEEMEEEEEVSIKVEIAEAQLQADLATEEDGLCWSEEMWAADTPPPSQNPSVPSGDVDETDSFRDLDWRDAIDDSKEQYEFELEMRRNATMNDHSYAANLILEEEPSLSATPDSPRKGIQGIILKEENGDDGSNGGPKKTKILVPLKDLIHSLKHKTFLISPLGPGKQIIRFTGKETVKGMLNHAAFNSSLKSVSSYCVPQTSLFNRSSTGSRSSSTTASSTSPPVTTTHRHKKSKTNRSIMREGGTITFPNQVPSPSSSTPPTSPASPTGSCSSPSSSSSALTASGRPKKTKTHNNMERMRRIDLRNSFDSLKKLVPPLAKSTKCSKVEILRRAEEYIRTLRALEKRLQREEAVARSRNEALKLKLLHSQQ